MEWSEGGNGVEWGREWSGVREGVEWSEEGRRKETITRMQSICVAWER